MDRNELDRWIVMHDIINARLATDDRLLQAAHDGDVERFYDLLDHDACMAMGQAEARRLERLKAVAAQTPPACSDDPETSEPASDRAVNRVKALAEARAARKGQAKVTCPDCGREVALLASGKLRAHNTPGGHRCPPAEE